MGVPEIVPREKVTNSDFKDWKSAAFTVAELGECLPHELDNRLLKTGKCFDGSWLVYYDAILGIPNPNWVEARRIYDQEAQTEADTRAKMLIYLVENKLVTL